MTTTQKRNLIFEAPNEAYYKLIDTRAKYNEFVKLSDLKAASILPKTPPTTIDFSLLTKTVLYDLLLMDKI